MAIWSNKHISLLSYNKITYGKEREKLHLSVILLFILFYFRDSCRRNSFWKIRNMSVASLYNVLHGARIRFVSTRAIVSSWRRDVNLIGILKRVVVWRVRGRGEDEKGEGWGRVRETLESAKEINNVFLSLTSSRITCHRVEHSA